MQLGNRQRLYKVLINTLNGGARVALRPYGTTMVVHCRRPRGGGDKLSCEPATNGFYPLRRPSPQVYLTSNMI